MKYPIELRGRLLIFFFIMWLINTFAAGQLTIARDEKNAQLLGEFLNQSARWNAFINGCFWGTVCSFALALFAFLIVKLSERIKERHWGSRRAEFIKRARESGVDLED